MRVAVVVGVVVDHDAISSAAHEQVAALQALPDVEDVLLFTQWCERDERCPTFVTANPWELLRHPDFRSCDVAIFHWGIHYDLFNAITLMGSPELPQPVVHFHNCTPPSLVDEAQRDHILGSIHQLHHVIDIGVPLWTYSEFNRRTLLDWGAAPGQIDWVTFPVLAPSPGQRRRDDGRIHLVTVGRLVPAKGVHVVLAALALLPEALLDRIRLQVVSSPTFSSDEYRTALDAALAAAPGVGAVVEFVVGPSDTELAEIYADADVVISPSFHEGLCVPVIEGYAAGCRAIGTTAGNLPFIVFPPDPVVPAGDPTALAGAIEQVVAAPEVDDERYLVRRRELVESFSPRAASGLLADALTKVLAPQAS